MRHTVEEKLNAIGMVKSGMTPCSVSRLLHLGHHSLYEWLAAYEEKGISGLKNKPRTRKNHLSFEEKRKIILECQQLDLPLYQISTKYGIGESTLSSWLAKVEQFGIDSLARKKSIKKDPDAGVAIPLSHGTLLLYADYDHQFHPIQMHPFRIRLGYEF